MDCDGPGDAAEGPGVGEARAAGAAGLAAAVSACGGVWSPCHGHLPPSALELACGRETSDMESQAGAVPSAG